MSRSNYSDECDGWALIRWRGAVNKAIKGARGQQLLKEMLAALDAMPVKRLITNDLIQPTGEVCALGCLGKARGVNMDDIDPEDPESVATLFGVAPALVQEIAYMNDDYYRWITTPEKRWELIRGWVAKQIKGN